MLAGAPRLDQPAMAQQGKMMADGGLALRAEIGAELGDISLFLAQEHEHLQASRIRDLLQQFGDATDLGRRSRGQPRADFADLADGYDLVEEGGIVFLKR